LKELGFTEREIRVYLALLETGKSTAGPVAIKAKLSQTKVYEALGKLVEKGIVNYIVVSKTKHFQAADPKQILDIIDQKREKFMEILHELEDKNRFGKEQQTTSIHEGAKAVRLLFFNIVRNLSKNDFYYAFALKEAYTEESAPTFFSAIHHLLAERKISDKALVSYSIKKEIKKTYANNRNIQLRFIKESLPVGVVILPDRIIQLSWGNLPTAIEIVSPQIARHYKNFFEDTWAKARK